MPYEFYKLMHILGLFLLFLAFGGLTYHAIMDGKRQFPLKKVLLHLHGWGLFFLLFAGFGMMARLQIGNSGGAAAWPMWIWLKLSAWILLGAAPTLMLRKPQWVRLSLIGILLLGLGAVSSAVFKPS